MTPEAQYLWQQIRGHVARFFTPEAGSLLDGRVRFTSYHEAVQLRGPLVAIPVDIPTPFTPARPYGVDFNGTQLTLWNPLPQPGGTEWTPLPNAKAPLWYRHARGTLLPAWNLFGTCLDLLTLREECESPLRDRHDRCLGDMSPRDAAGVLEVPAVNEAIAALVAACAGLARHQRPDFHLDGLLQPPVLVLSHDVDQLRGNDGWTQAVRLWHGVAPLLQGRLPQPKQLWWALRNAVRPYDFFLDNLAGMVEVERMLGYTSTFYFLNGSGGRYGARSGSELIPRALRDIPPAWSVGMHYNYDTYLDDERFSAQRAELSTLLGQVPEIGRAHYLRFNPEHSYRFLAKHGMRIDESPGYPDRIGYRCGIAGPYQPYDRRTPQGMALQTLPLVVMDITLLEQYPDDPVGAFRRLLAHLRCIGGAASLLMHPGCFYNPEVPAARGLYRRLLGIAHRLGYQGTSITRFLAEPRRHREEEKRLVA